MYPESFNNQRQSSRASSSLPIQISIDSQITLKGELKDLSLKSAFIRVKTSVYIQTHDEVDFTIQLSPTDLIKGSAHISRISPGEGFAIYFTTMDDASTTLLKKIVE